MLYLGLAGNIPRIVLYFVLSPFLGVTGAALAYFSGSLFQLILTIRKGKNQNLIIEYKKYAILTAIPLVIGVAVWVSNLYFVISSVIILLGSYLVYARMNMLTDKEVHDIMYAGLPKNVAASIYPPVSKMIRRISD